MMVLTLGLGFSRQGGSDQSTMYLINEISSLKRSMGSLDTVDSKLMNVANKLTQEMDTFKSMISEELQKIRDTTPGGIQSNLEDSVKNSLDMIEERTRYIKDFETNIEGVRNKFEESLKSGDRVFKFIKEEYDTLSKNITKLSTDLGKASGDLDKALGFGSGQVMEQINQNFASIESRFDTVAEQVGEKTSELFSGGIFREQFTQNLLNDVQQILGETMPLILEEEVGKSLEKLGKAPEVVEAAEKVDIASLELKDLASNLDSYLQTLAQDVKSISAAAQQSGGADLKVELAGFLNSMQDQLDTIKNYESTITQVLRTELPKLAGGGGGSGGEISSESFERLSQAVGQKVEESTLELKNTAMKMHDVFSKFNEQMARMVAFLEALKAKEDELKQREARIAEYERRMR